ncbi:M23 family metallopeptidase [Desulfobacter sp.]|uniref:M23 family metallopeptidase n=1 Tax=Desulfobacter sp. TaxID=2294 RepID=UPI003D09B8B9
MPSTQPTGTAVEAVSNGRVISAESDYYAGNSMYIDHGNGVISFYFHLSRLDVSLGRYCKNLLKNLILSPALKKRATDLRRDSLKRLIRVFQHVSL